MKLTCLATLVAALLWQLSQPAAAREYNEEAEFRSFASKELELLKADLLASGVDSAKAAAVVQKVKKFADSIAPLEVGLADKRAALEEFIVRVRKLFGVRKGSLATTEPSELTEKDKSELAKVLEKANWQENTKNLPKEWWGRTKPWVSADGLVTFAVGRIASRSTALARNVSAARARWVLTGGRNVVAEGLFALRYEYQDGIMYCLVAVPTSLLPPVGLTRFAGG